MSIMISNKNGNAINLVAASFIGSIKNESISILIDYYNGEMDEFFKSACEKKEELTISYGEYQENVITASDFFVQADRAMGLHENQALVSFDLNK